MGDVMKAKIIAKGVPVIINFTRGPQGSVLASNVFMFKKELAAWVVGFRNSPMPLRKMEVA